MAGTKQAHPANLAAEEAPAVRTTWKGLPVEFHAARLSMRQRLLPLAGLLSPSRGDRGFDGVPRGRFQVHAHRGGKSWTGVALLEVVRFDLELT
jgi:hypothetical protein